MHLNHLLKLIAEKSFHYSDLICTVPRKSVRTKAKSSLKAINLQIYFHCQVYSWYQLHFIHLGANLVTLQQFWELKKQDIKASTEILTPNESGSTT